MSIEPSRMGLFIQSQPQVAEVSNDHSIEILTDEIAMNSLQTQASWLDDITDRASLICLFGKVVLLEAIRGTKRGLVGVILFTPFLLGGKGIWQHYQNDATVAGEVKCLVGRSLAIMGLSGLITFVILGTVVGIFEGIVNGVDELSEE